MRLHLDAAMSAKELQDFVDAAAAIERAFPEGFDIARQQARLPKGWDRDELPTIEDRVAMVIAALRKIGISISAALRIVEAMNEKGKLGRDEETSAIVRERL